MYTKRHLLRDIRDVLDQSNSMAASESQFTVAKLDAGMAILLTSDHHLIEFPSLLLPSGVVAGSVIDLSVAQNSKKEAEESEQFKHLQNQIRDLFISNSPSAPNLRIRNVTQTSVVLEWDLINLATAEMKSLTLLKNRSRLGKIPNATTTTTKLSGLALDTDYHFQLVLKTTAGTYKSEEVRVRTHKMTNLSGINACASNLSSQEREDLAAALARIGAKPLQDRVRIDTTHFITNKGEGDEYTKALGMNIPVVVPEFVQACEIDGRLVRVGAYYLDSDPALREKKSQVNLNTAQPAGPSDSKSGSQLPETIAKNASGPRLTEAKALTPSSTQSPLPMSVKPEEGDEDERDVELPQRARGEPRTGDGDTNIVEQAIETVRAKGSEGFQKLSKYLDGTAETEESTQDRPSANSQETKNDDEIADVAGETLSTTSGPVAQHQDETHLRTREIEVDGEPPRSANKVKPETKAGQAENENFPPSMGRSHTSEYASGAFESVAL